MQKLTKQRLFGILEMGLGLYWAWFHLRLLYLYTFHPDILWVYMKPSWILIFEATVGLTGTYFGWLVYNEKWSILKGYLWFAVIWLIGFAIEMIVVMF